MVKVLCLLLGPAALLSKSVLKASCCALLADRLDAVDLADRGGACDGAEIAGDTGLPLVGVVEAAAAWCLPLLLLLE